VTVDSLFEIAGGVALSGTEVAPSDFRKYFRTMQYFYFILSALKQGHFEYAIPVQQLMYGVYLMKTVGGAAAVLHLPTDHQHLWRHAPHTSTNIVSGS
jgi:hypothetical protein